MSILGIVLLVILVLMLFGSVPVYPYNRGWGVYPAGGLGLVLVVVPILVLLGHL